MSKFCLSTFFLLIAYAYCAQKNKIYSLPNKIDTLFVDSILTVSLKENSRIVVLGEENHGGELTNKLNAAIINRLVEKHNFSSLFIESDFFGLSYADSLDKNVSFTKNIYPAWSKSVSFTSIKDLYLQNKLKIIGYDARHHGATTKQHLIKYLKDNNPNNEENKTIFLETTQSLIENEFKDTLLAINKELYFTYLTNWKNELAKDSTSFLYQTLSNLINYAHQLLVEQTSGVEAYVAQRELNMIANISYLLQQEEEKVIILGASLHTQPYITTLSQHADRNVGDFILEKYKEQVLFLFPLIYSGTTQNFGNYPVQKIKKGKQRKTIQKALAKKSDFALIETCNYMDYKLFRNANQLINNEFCGYFLFIKEEDPRQFYEKN